MTRLRLLLIAAAALPGAIVLAPSPADAACNPSSLCSCTVTATGVSFGAYNPLSTAARDSTGSVRVRCTLLVALPGSFTVDLNAGASGTYANRTLRSGASSLNYNLFTDLARTQIWGNGAGGSVRVTHNFSNLLVVDRTFTAYGRIAARQNVRAGSYSDTITVTVTY
jgi:spore coat protein U-like protein